MHLFGKFNAISNGFRKTKNMNFLLAGLIFLFVIIGILTNKNEDL